MKDLELPDIFERTNVITTRLSVYEDGLWRFIQLDPTTNVKTYENQTFYKINQLFGLVKEGVNDPSIVSVLGQPGEYVGVSFSGRLYKLTVKEFLSIFPRQILARENRNYNSERLRDPNFITKIVKGSGPTDSNSTMPAMTSPKPTTYYNPPKVSSGCGCKN